MESALTSHGSSKSNKIRRTADESRTNIELAYLYNKICNPVNLVFLFLSMQYIRLTTYCHIFEKVLLTDFCLFQSHLLSQSGNNTVLLFVIMTSSPNILLVYSTYFFLQFICQNNTHLSMLSHRAFMIYKYTYHRCGKKNVAQDSFY